MLQRAVFLDRDGVLLRPVIENNKPRPPYNRSEFLGLCEGVAEALALCRGLGFLLILISNQPDLAYGNISQTDWDWINSHVLRLQLDDYFICFHGRDEDCDCKKPKPGLILTAVKEWDLDLSRSFIIGDTCSDTEAGRAAGCKTVLIQTSYNKDVEADFYANSFFEAAVLIRGLLRGGKP